jgi:hypothetical protein
MVNYVQPTNEDECHCEDPYTAGKKLMLCGSAVCKRLFGDLPKPTLIRSNEEDTETDTSSS